MQCGCHRHVSVGLLSGVLLSLLLISSLLLCRYTSSIGSWLPCVVLVGISAIVFCVQLCISKNIRINVADILLLSYCLYAVTRMLLAGESYTEPLTKVKWLLLGLMYIIGRLSDGKYVPLVLIAVGLGGVLSFLFGFFFNSGHLGAYISIGLSGVVCLLSEKDRPLLEKSLLALLGLLLLIVLVLSKSRGALLAFFVAVAYLFFSSGKFNRLKIERKRLVFVLLACMALFGVFLLYRIRPGSADVRLLIWSASSEAFLKAPLFGYSSGAVQSLYMLWQAEYFQAHPLSSFAPLGTNHYQTFNEYLRILCEQGFAGFVLFTLFVVFAFRKSKNRGVNAASISLGVSSFFLYTYDIIPVIILAPLFLGFASSSKGIHSPKKKSRLAAVPVCVCVMLSAAFVCWSVGRKYYSAEKDLRHFIRLPEDCITNRISPSSESIIFRNKDMTLLYANHSFRLSSEDRIAVLEHCAKRITVVEMMSALGNLHLQSSQTEEAEACFLAAQNMTPDRIVPKYDLFKFYRDKGDKDKAKECAEVIIQSSPRTYNAVTIEIKAEARDYVENYP